ncbi:AAR2 domain containing protein [Colletotrichum tofieldiae]|uniref:AAR2 domain containing protein n=1 Tax=Colletotrichum tofieldiae TaxID=708197 RepID=A0A166MQ25_9PEZI|nr:AAR2 domain containing protein [Colletotrichum tofieldiae]GKT73887.1 AAR2 domain containing protein [Colletotrichum tofieldiae]GKT95858.1 AAR2 domain containing protein [Colletotrichum tofieldiae]
MTSGASIDAPIRPALFKNSGLPKSDSSVSTTAPSCKSIRVTGAHPLGSLHVHQPVDLSRSQEVAMNPNTVPDDDEPPPLGPIEPQDAVATQRPSSQHEHSLGGGDIVLIMDLPTHFTVGYDSVSFTAREFVGVRDVPPGPHFFWVSETEASTTRCGFWVISSASDKIHVMQWDKFNEVVGEPASQVEARFQKDNIQDIYPKLAPYQFRALNATVKSVTAGSSSPEPEFARNTNIWQQLTNAVSAPLLTRITARQAGDWAVHTSDRVRGALMLPAEVELEKRMPSVVASTELNFTFSQGAKTYDAESVGAARTEQAVDATAYLLSTGISDDDIVGELQFAFIVGMHLGNEACVQQWWHMLVSVVLKAYTLPLKRPELARALLQTITAQLVYNERYLDGSVLDYGPSYSRDLRMALIVYKRRLNEVLLALNSLATPEQASVGQAFSELETWVWKFGWDIRSDYLRKGKKMLEDGEEVELEMDDLEAEDERGEFAATVVELDESGKQKDLVSWD